jgi:hypothetical protein
MTESRFAGVRAQVRTVRRVAAAAAVVGFAVLVGLARESHPGTSASAGTGSSTGTSTVTDSTETQSDDGFSNFSFDGGDISPSTGGSPQVQSSGS